MYPRRHSKSVSQIGWPIPTYQQGLGFLIATYAQLGRIAEAHELQQRSPASVLDSALVLMRSPAGRESLRTGFERATAGAGA